MARIMQRSGHCPICEARRLCEKKVPRHGMHATLFLLTGGMSSVTSGITYAAREAASFRCQTCGSKMSEVYDD